MKRYTILLGALLLMFSAAGAETKIAVIDLDRAFQEYYKTKVAEANLKRQAEVYKEHAMRIEERIKLVQDEFIRLRDASLSVVLTDTARESKRLEAQEKYRILMQLQKELKDFTQEKQEQLRDERDKNRARIFQDIRDCAQKMASLGGFQIVIDRSAVSMSTLSAVIWCDPAIDITDAVLKNLNTGHTETTQGGAK